MNAKKLDATQYLLSSKKNASLLGRSIEEPRGWREIVGELNEGYQKTPVLFTVSKKG